jgi:hypothetical protein
MQNHFALQDFSTASSRLIMQLQGRLKKSACAKKRPGDSRPFKKIEQAAAMGQLP